MSVAVKDKVALEAALNGALENARLIVAGNKVPNKLPSRTREAIKKLSGLVDSQATAAFTNLITCLVANAANPKCDPRYHRSRPNDMPAPPPGRVSFSGRAISEKIVYPWLRVHGFRGAKSGWQTRVFERPAPYLKDYVENINKVKDEFLGILDDVACGKALASDVLTEFLVLELREQQARNEARVSLIPDHLPTNLVINDIVASLMKQFELNYSARLPVIAIYALYQAIIPQFNRYARATLKPLENHSASDLSTGSFGDIEIASDLDGTITEVVEVKHSIKIDDEMVRTAVDKIETSNGMIKRYYILSTADANSLTSLGNEMIADARTRLGCEIVVNGIVPTIKYYLRVLEDPSDFCTHYSAALAAACDLNSHVKRAHLEHWCQEMEQMLR